MTEDAREWETERESHPRRGGSESGAQRAGLKERGRPARREGALWEGVVRWQAGRLHSLNFSASQRLVYLLGGHDKF